MLKKMRQILPLNSNKQQGWEHLHESLNFSLMELATLVQRNLIWDRLKKNFNNDAWEKEDVAIGQGIYENGLPFNLVWYPYWTKMIK